MLSGVLIGIPIGRTVSDVRPILVYESSRILAPKVYGWRLNDTGERSLRMVLYKPSSGLCGAVRKVAKDVSLTERVLLEKVTAFVTRDAAQARELLVFRHPHAGVQIPAGTVEKGESAEAAALREV